MQKNPFNLVLGGKKSFFQFYLVLGGKTSFFHFYYVLETYTSSMDSKTKNLKVMKNKNIIS